MGYSTIKIWQRNTVELADLAAQICWHVLRYRTPFGLLGTVYAGNVNGVVSFAWLPPSLEWQQYMAFVATWPAATKSILLTQSTHEHQHTP